MRTKYGAGNSGRQSELLDAAREQLGEEAIAKTKSGHWKIVMGDGSKVVISSTPSDKRTFYNDRARLRRHGLEV